LDVSYFFEMARACPHLTDAAFRSGCYSQSEASSEDESIVLPDLVCFSLEILDDDESTPLEALTRTLKFPSLTELQLLFDPEGTPSGLPRIPIKHLIDFVHPSRCMLTRLTIDNLWPDLSTGDMLAFLGALPTLSYVKLCELSVEQFEQQTPQPTGDTNTSIHASTIVTPAFLARLSIPLSPLGAKSTILLPKLLDISLTVRSPGFHPESFVDFIKSRCEAKGNINADCRRICAASLDLTDGSFPLKSFKDIQHLAGEGILVEVTDKWGDLTLRETDHCT
jgi:hypothetical protein